jgi:hypothetical protein
MRTDVPEPQRAAVTAAQFAGFFLLATKMSQFKAPSTYQNFTFTPP